VERLKKVFDIKKHERDRRNELRICSGRHIRKSEGNEAENDNKEMFMTPSRRCEIVFLRINILKNTWDKLILGGTD
jgi:hypothetical protein